MSNEFVPWPTSDNQNKEVVKKEESVAVKAEKNAIVHWPTPPEGIQQIRNLAENGTILKNTKAEYERAPTNPWYACLRTSLAVLSGNIEMDEEVSSALGKERSQEILAELNLINADLEKLKEQYPSRGQDVPEDKFQIVLDIAERIQNLYKKAAE